jgi:hypothetical protein
LPLFAFLFRNSVRAVDLFNLPPRPTSWKLDARSRSDYKLAISGLILSSEVRLPTPTVITAVTVISLHPGEPGGRLVAF